MTDRINGLYVVLDHDIREDDVEHIVNAIRQIRCVLDVQKNISNFELFINKRRLKNELLEEVISIFTKDRNEI